MDGQDLAKQEQFLEMDKRDEEQILEELQGNILQEMFYIGKDGKAVTSWIGIKEIARKYGGIDVNLVEKSDLGDYWSVVVKASDKRNGYSMLGVSTQTKLMDVHDFELDENGRYKLTKEGKKIWAKDEKGDYKFHKETDTYVLQKALSKAQRNAIKALIPETFFAQMIDTWRKTPKGTQTQAPKKVESNAKVKENPAFTSAADLPKVPDDFRPSEEAAHIVDYVCDNFDQNHGVIRAMIYKEMNAIEPHLTDVEAARVIQGSFEERSQTPQVSDSTLEKAMLDAGLDPDKVNISPEEDEVQPKKFLGDIWGKYHDFLKLKGFNWIKDDKNSRWEKK